jgi:hypothetical protein
MRNFHTSDFSFVVRPFLGIRTSEVISGQKNRLLRKIAGVAAASHQAVPAVSSVYHSNTMLASARIRRAGTLVAKLIQQQGEFGTIART